MSQDELTDLQRAIDDSGYDWQAGPTSLTALPPEEQSVRLGLKVDEDELARIISMMSEELARAAEFPAAWDWRDVEGVDWTTGVRDQQACGSCVAFGAVGVLESMLMLHHDDAGLQPDLSEAHLFFCGCGACCDEGWWPTYALDYAQASGVPDEVCFPYEDHDMSCEDTCLNWQDRAVKVTAWQEVTDAGLRKEWLATKGPMIGCMAIYQDFFSYTNGVYRHTLGNLSGYHAVAVVGYSEADGAWICKNSWGTDWGDSGWFKIAYGECGMDTQFAMYGVEDVAPPSPDPGPDPEPDPDPGPQPGGCSVWARFKSAVRGLWE